MEIIKGFKSEIFVNNNDGILSSVLINLESKKFLRVTDIYKERHQFIDIKKEN